MNILLVYPEMPFAFWSMNHLLRMSGKKASYPPVGLLTVAAMLPREWNKRLVDLNIAELTDADLTWADYAFIGAMNVQAMSARQVMARCRRAGVKIVAGGPLFTHEYEGFPGVDHFVLNEAEVTLPRFLEDLQKGCAKPIYTSPEMADVHETPVPLWELADLSQYGFAIVQYSRGCPYQCDFCDVTVLFGRKPRTKTPKQIIAELEALEDLDRFDLVVFADDNLIGNKKLLKTELLPALIEWRKRKKPLVSFATQVTITLADDCELMELMLEAGFRHIFVGIETPEEEGLIACKKRQNTRRNLLQNVRLLHRAGFIVTAGFIVGFDTDTPSIFQSQIDFIQNSGIVVAGVSVLKAPPGTELYERMKREGRLIYEFDFHESQTNIVPKMDARLLSEGYRKVLKHIYSPEHVCERAMRFLSDYQKDRQDSGAYGWELRHLGIACRYLGILARIIFWVGIRGKQRRHFWKLIKWTLAHRPERIDLALFFGVWMYEFNEMYKTYDASGHFDIYKVPMTLANKSQVAV
ncbi:MAG: B12-binding domain-containing radical SAM protein [Gammaproteobacteria bacterium]